MLLCVGRGLALWAILVALTGFSGWAQDEEATAKTVAVTGKLAKSKKKLDVPVADKHLAVISATDWNRYAKQHNEEPNVIQIGPMLYRLEDKKMVLVTPNAVTGPDGKFTIEVDPGFFKDGERLTLIEIDSDPWMVRVAKKPVCFLFDTSKDIDLGVVNRQAQIFKLPIIEENDPCLSFEARRAK
jgi:hypothetical protein